MKLQLLRAVISSDFLRRPPNLKMSNQVGYCFKFLWPFQNVRTLILMMSDDSMNFVQIFKIPTGKSKTGLTSISQH